MAIRANAGLISDKMMGNAASLEKEEKKLENISELKKDKEVVKDTDK